MSDPKVLAGFAVITNGQADSGRYGGPDGEADEFGKGRAARFGLLLSATALAYHDGKRRWIPTRVAATNRNTA